MERGGARQIDRFLQGVQGRATSAQFFRGRKKEGERRICIVKTEKWGRFYASSKN